MLTAQQAVAETLRQLVHGKDFEPPSKLLGSIKSEQAVAIAPGCPYSIATNISHAEQWQRSWLHSLKKLPRFDVWKDGKDFPVVPPQDWDAVREAFLSGLNDALALAEGSPFAHQMRSEEAALRKLNQIAIHGAYHIGQVRLLKRILWATRQPSKSSEKPHLMNGE
jgi:hypothetical protein